MNLVSYLQSEQIDKLAASLSKAQGSLESALKDASNPFYKSKYADLPSVWEAARIPLSSNGLGVVQQFIYESEKTILVTTLTHSSGQWMRSFLPVVTTKADAQGMGAGITYMRRYAMCAIVGITQDDDDGETAVGRGKYDKKVKKPEFSPITESSNDFKHHDFKDSPTEIDKVSNDQGTELLNLFNSCSPSLRETLNTYITKDLGVNSIQLVPAIKYKALKERMHTDAIDYAKKQQEMAKEFFYENTINT